MTSGRRSASTRMATKRLSATAHDVGIGVCGVVHGGAFFRPRRDEGQQNRLVFGSSLGERRGRTSRAMRMVSRKRQIIMTGSGCAAVCVCARLVSLVRRHDHHRRGRVARLRSGPAHGSFSSRTSPAGCCCVSLLAMGLLGPRPSGFAARFARGRGDVRRDDLRRPRGARADRTASCSIIVVCGLALLFWEARDGTRAA